MDFVFCIAGMHLRYTNPLDSFCFLKINFTHVNNISKSSAAMHTEKCSRELSMQKRTVLLQYSNKGWMTTIIKGQMYHKKVNAQYCDKTYLFYLSLCVKYKLDLAFNNVKPKDWYFVLDQVRIRTGLRCVRWGGWPM